MPDDRRDFHMTAPLGDLERALIDEYLRAHGFDADRLRELPKAELKRVLTDASVYAATRLAEVESRAHYVHEIHRER